MDSKELIKDLQGHFDGRSRLNKAVTAIRHQKNGASIFYSYVDNWNKKQFVNIPIDPDEILPILEKYIENIDKDIQKMIGTATTSDDEDDDDDDFLVNVEILNKDEFDTYAEGTRDSVQFDEVIKFLSDQILHRYQRDGEEDEQGHDIKRVRCGDYLHTDAVHGNSDSCLVFEVMQCEYYDGVINVGVNYKYRFKL